MTIKSLHSRRALLSGAAASSGLLVLTPPRAQAAATAQETGFLNRSVTSDGVAYAYQVYVPATWKAGTRWPVILFLHGAGERGDNGTLQTELGLPSAVRRTPERFPALIVMPQCRKGTGWNALAMEKQALGALDAAMKEFSGDPKRVYMTGQSMGGYGTYSIGYRHRDRFAALAPICGGVRRLKGWKDAAAMPFPAENEKDPVATVAAALKDKPIWIFHGAKDDRVPVEESRLMAKALEAVKGNFKYTEFPDIGHGGWDSAYRDPEFPVWLFKQMLR